MQSISCRSATTGASSATLPKSRTETRNLGLFLFTLRKPRVSHSPSPEKADRSMPIIRRMHPAHMQGVAAQEAARVAVIHYTHSTRTQRRNEVSQHHVAYRAVLMMGGCYCGMKFPNTTPCAWERHPIHTQRRRRNFRHACNCRCTSAFKSNGNSRFHSVCSVFSNCLFLARADAADRGAAVRAFTFGDGLAVLRQALNRVLHLLFRLALHAIRLNCHNH